MLRIVLGVAIAICTLAPNVSVADDQQIADYIKSRLQVEQQRGNLSGFNVDMRVEQGTVWFKGFVSNEMQEMTILQTAQRAGNLGVVQVVDDIEVRGMASRDNKVMPTQYEQSVYERTAQRPDYTSSYPTQNAVVPPRETVIPNMVNSTIDARAALSNGTPMPFAQAGAAQSGVPAMQTSSMVGSPSGMSMAPMSAGPAAVPMSMQDYGAMGGATGGGYEAPNLPGYAWPGYASHPNYAAVSYPRQHSASAWPYIGPFYPYPQVPLGWRKVSLEWDDGWWMLDFHDK